MKLPRPTPLGWVVLAIVVFWSSVAILIASLD